MSRDKKRTRTPRGGGESDDDISVLDPALNSGRNSGRSSRKSSRTNSLRVAQEFSHSRRLAFEFTLRERDINYDDET